MGKKTTKPVDSSHVPDNMPVESKSVTKPEPQPVRKDAIRERFVIKEYVSATGDAAARTRTVTYILIIATILIGIGFWNSLRGAWATERVKAAYDKNYTDKYKLFIDDKLLLENNHLERNLDKKRFDEILQEQALRGFIDNVRFVRIPILGIAIDVNDLGPIGGLTLIIMLLLLRFSLSREIKNLNVSFREAVRHNQLCGFYHSLAMRLVLTVPKMRGETQNQWLVNAAIYICVLPFVVFTLGAAYDYVSVFEYELYGFLEVLPTLVINIIWVIVIAILTKRCLERLEIINKIWEDHWNRMEGLNSPVILLDENLVKKFGSDKAINKALKSLQNKTPENTSAPASEKPPEDDEIQGVKSSVVLLDDEDLVKEFGNDRAANEALKNLQKNCQLNE